MNPGDRRWIVRCLLPLLVLVCGACTGYSLPRAVYEGVQTRDRLQTAPAERAAQPELNYQQYDAERKRTQ